MLNDKLDALVIFAPIILEQACCFCIGGRVRIRIAQQALNRCQHCTDVVDRTPIALQYVETYAAIGVHIGVEQFRREFDQWWLVRVIFGEFKHQFERTAFPRCLLWSAMYIRGCVRRCMHVSLNSTCDYSSSRGEPRCVAPNRAKYLPENHCVPLHNVVITWCTTDSSRWVLSFRVRACSHLRQYVLVAYEACSMKLARAHTRS